MELQLLKNLFLVVIGPRNLKRGSANQIPDEILAADICSTGNTLLFGELYDRYSSRVYNKCLQFTKEEESARDLTQDIFIKVYLSLHTFKARARFSTWLFSITYNFCVNFVQRDKGHKLANLSDQLTEDTTGPDPSIYIDETKWMEIRVSKLKLALECIPPADKALLLLKYQDEISMKELQEILNLGESAVKMRLMRARQKLLEAHKSLA